jgi:hypothetical protein
MPRRMRDKRLTMVVLFVGCGCVAETSKNVLFLRRKTYGGIDFWSRPKANRGYAVNMNQTNANAKGTPLNANLL